MPCQDAKPRYSQRLSAQSLFSSILAVQFYNIIVVYQRFSDVYFDIFDVTS